MKKKEKSQSDKRIESKRLVLLDAHAVIHRAYHALPDFATSRGEPTGALYGLTGMIMKIVAELKPDYIVAAYDLPKPTYRHDAYANYKAGRVKADEALAMQLESSKRVCGALSIPIYSKEGFEADDMLGTIVEEMRNKGVEIIIASGDMDTLQLVDDAYAKVYTLKKGLNDTILYDEKAVRDRFGFGPELLPDYKGLRGDPSDNIVGIAGIGEKTATDLIVNFGTIENIYKILEAKKGYEKLEKVGIKKRIIELLKEGKEEATFSKMLATIRRDAPIDFKLPEKSWKETVDLQKAKELFSELEFRTMGNRLEQILGPNSQEKVIHSEETGPAGDAGEAGASKEEVEETLIALWVVDSSKTDPTLEDVFQFGKTNDFKKAKERIFAEMDKREVRSVFENIEKPLIPIVEEMGRYGVLINKQFLENLGKAYAKELGDIEQDVWNEAGESFNVASPKQLGKILFEKLGLKVKNQKKTAGGAISTRESELEKMKDLHPIIPLVLEFRELSKLIGTYIEPIPQLLDQDNRLHATFIQAGAATGRMASKNPGLQNIPVGTERGRAIRTAFIAPQGKKLVAFDYSQIELRIAAFLSKDEKLISIFKAGLDVHAGVASQMFDVSPQEVTKEMRRQAKVINFGILYGMGVVALQQNLGTDRKTAQEFYNTYFRTFTGLAAYLEQQKELAHKQGFVTTLFGRRRYFEGIKSKIPYIRAAAERMAVNAPMQGTQSDIIKIAMTEVHKWLSEAKLSEKAHLIMQVHDELIYEIDENYIPKCMENIKSIMENIIPAEETLGVPIVVNASVGDNYGELK